MITLVLATRNQHKVGEIQQILGPGYAWLTLAELPDSPTVAEDADTFAGNALKKAVGLAQWLADRADPRVPTDAAVLADDSGLEVDALGGLPGVHSARFAALEAGRGANASDAENNAKLLHLLRGVPPAARTARFRCVVALVAVPTAGSAPTTQFVFDGVCEGVILEAARGEDGFGYDPLFQPLGYTATFAELGDQVKNRISHRARALALLRRRLEADSGAGSGTR